MHGMICEAQVNIAHRIHNLRAWQQPMDGVASLNACNLIGFCPLQACCFCATCTAESIIRTQNCRVFLVHGCPGWCSSCGVSGKKKITQPYICFACKKWRPHAVERRRCSISDTLLVNVSLENQGGLVKAQPAMHTMDAANLDVCSCMSRP